MSLFSPWLIVGFVMGVMAGTLATDLNREDIGQRIAVEKTIALWRWPRTQLLISIGFLWAVLLITTIIALGWGETEWWKNITLGTIAGAAAAPWVWLHFVRTFGNDAARALQGRDTLIIALAHQIWISEGQPDGRRDENYAAAEAQVDSIQQSFVDESSKMAEQQLARYRLISIIMGIIVLVALLRPILQDWLPRTQQFNAFGVSFTLLAGQRGDRGNPNLHYSSGSSAEPGGDRGDALLRGTSEAYEVGAATLRNQFTALDLIGPDLANFGNLSVIDRDRAFIAWLTYEQLPKNSSTLFNVEHGKKRSLGEYVEVAERSLDVQRRWTKPDVDIAFAVGSTILSDCLHTYAEEVHDPIFFTDEVGRFLRRFIGEVRRGHSWPFYYPPLFGIDSEFLSDCNYNIGNYSTRNDDRNFRVTPYPSLIAANYLAAIGSVDTGVLLIEDWIEKEFYERHPTFVPGQNLQLSWYLLRGKLSAVNLLYQFNQGALSHRQLISWQSDESEQFASMLHLGDAPGWKRLCDRLLTPSMHNNLGQWLALSYATDRFYLFENLTPEDFDLRNELKLKTLMEYVQEAESIRDDQECFKSVPTYKAYERQYKTYFYLYTVQLQLIQLQSEDDPVRRKKLIETIDNELVTIKELGTPSFGKPQIAFLRLEEGRSIPTLSTSGDLWDRHRLRLSLLRADLESEKKRE